MPSAQGLDANGSARPLVELCHTEVQLGQVRALRGVELQLWPGEIVTVVGESGCGKSTLGRAVLGLLPPTRGQVLYQGQNIFAPGFRMSDALRLSVQVVHQDSYASLNPVRTVGQQLAAPLRRHRLAAPKEVKAKVHEILTQVGLTPPEFFAAKVPFQLSGGQRQRVSLARAALLRPRLIVADEPVSGVDATLRLAILELMRRLNSEGIAFLYITHDLGTARYLGRGGRMLVMYLGQVIESGPVEELLDNPLHPYLQALLAALPPLDPRRAREAAPLVAAAFIPAAPTRGPAALRRRRTRGS
jgi:peptide/nickel transport system ATP-binding protein